MFKPYSEVMTSPGRLISQPVRAAQDAPTRGATVRVALGLRVLRVPDWGCAVLVSSFQVPRLPSSPYASSPSPMPCSPLIVFSSWSYLRYPSTISMKRSASCRLQCRTCLAVLSGFWSAVCGWGSCQSTELTERSEPKLASGPVVQRDPSGFSLRPRKLN